MDKDIETDSEWISSGIAGCTGIKALDFRRADKEARSSLSLLVEAKVSSFIQSRTRTSNNQVVLDITDMSTEVTSSMILNFSQIFARWVDVNICLVHSGVKISHKEIEAAVKRLQMQEASKIINKKIRVVGFENSNRYSQLVALGKDLLSDVGAKTVEDAEEDVDIIFSLQVVDISTITDQHLTVSVQASLRSTATREVLWSQLVKGKGVSLRRRSRDFLLDRAIESAIEKISAPLAKILREPRAPVASH